MITTTRVSILFYTRSTHHRSTFAKDNASARLYTHSKCMFSIIMNNSSFHRTCTEGRQIDPRFWKEWVESSRVSRHSIVPWSEEKKEGYKKIRGNYDKTYRSHSSFCSRIYIISTVGLLDGTLCVTSDVGSLSSLLRHHIYLLFYFTFTFSPFAMGLEFQHFRIAQLIENEDKRFYLNLMTSTDSRMVCGST